MSEHIEHIRPQVESDGPSSERCEYSQMSQVFTKQTVNCFGKANHVICSKCSTRGHADLGRCLIKS